MKTIVELSRKIVDALNELRPISKPSLWIKNDDAGNVIKCRVYLNGDKGYIEVRSETTVYLETVGRNTFTEARAVADGLGLKRVFA